MVGRSHGDGLPSLLPRPSGPLPPLPPGTLLKLFSFLHPGTPRVGGGLPKGCPPALRGRVGTGGPRFDCSSPCRTHPRPGSRAVPRPVHRPLGARPPTTPRPPRPTRPARRTSSLPRRTPPRSPALSAPSPSPAALGWGVRFVSGAGERTTPLESVKALSQFWTRTVESRSAV